MKGILETYNGLVSVARRYAFLIRRWSTYNSSRQCHHKDQHIQPKHKCRVLPVYNPGGQGNTKGRGYTGGEGEGCINRSTRWVQDAYVVHLKCVRLSESIFIRVQMKMLAVLSTYLEVHLDCHIPPSSYETLHQLNYTDRIVHAQWQRERNQCVCFTYK